MINDYFISLGTSVFKVGRIDYLRFLREVEGTSEFSMLLNYYSENMMPENSFSMAKDIFQTMCYDGRLTEAGKALLEILSYSESIDKPL